MPFIKKLWVICLVTDQKITSIIFHAMQKSDIVLYFLNRKFLQMFSNNLNFISVSMHKVEVYKKFSFLDFTVESPKSMFPFSPLLAPTLSASFGEFPRNQSFPIMLDHHDQVERERLKTSRIFRTFLLIPFFLTTDSVCWKGKNTRKKNHMS